MNRMNRLKSDVLRDLNGFVVESDDIPGADFFAFASFDNAIEKHFSLADQELSLAATLRHILCFEQFA